MDSASFSLDYLRNFSRLVSGIGLANKRKGISKIWPFEGLWFPLIGNATYEDRSNNNQMWYIRPDFNRALSVFTFPTPKHEVKSS